MGWGTPHAPSGPQLEGASSGTSALAPPVCQVGVRLPPLCTPRLSAPLPLCFRLGGHRRRGPSSAARLPHQGRAPLSRSPWCLLQSGLVVVTVAWRPTAQGVSPGREVLPSSFTPPGLVVLVSKDSPSPAERCEGYVVLAPGTHWVGVQADPGDRYLLPDLTFPRVQCRVSQPSTDDSSYYYPGRNLKPSGLLG